MDYKASKYYLPQNQTSRHSVWTSISCLARLLSCKRDLVMSTHSKLLSSISTSSSFPCTLYTSELSSCTIAIKSVSSTWSMVHLVSTSTCFGTCLSTCQTCWTSFTSVSCLSKKGSSMTYCAQMSSLILTSSLRFTVWLSCLTLCSFSWICSCLLATRR